MVFDFHPEAVDEVTMGTAATYRNIPQADLLQIHATANNNLQETVIDYV